MLHLDPSSDAITMVVTTTLSILLGDTVRSHYITCKHKRNQYKVQRKVADRLHMSADQLTKKYGPNVTPLR